MSILVFAENHQGKYKKSAFEAVYFGSKLAESTGTDCKVLTIGKAENIAELSYYGASNIFRIQGNSELEFDAQTFAKAISDFAGNEHCDIVILAHSSQGKALAGRVSIRLQAGLVTAINELPETESGFMVTKSLFSGKATANYKISSSKKVLTLVGNAIKLEKVEVSSNVQDVTYQLDESKVKVLSTKTVEGIVPLPEAELVVSAGRGMKGPENWGIIEELAEVMHATTACSRPVADADWRPHHEHVGQTGVAIRPNLYIAIGISGAIQHLAGVNNSKVIVVINKDPEAPFFKAADYGVVGDLFDVVPRLTEAYKKVMAG